MEKQKKPVQVSIEVFGKKKLVAEIDPDRLQGQSLGQVIDYMVKSRQYEGQDARTLATIQREMGASGGYTSFVGTRSGDNLPVRFEPTRLDAPAREYIQQSPAAGTELRITVQGKHVVG